MAAGDDRRPAATEADASARTGFGYNPLDRQAGWRDDPTRMEALWTEPTTRCLVLAGEDVVLRGEADALFLPAQTATLGPVRERAFLGTGPDGALFAIRLEGEPDLPEPLTRLGVRAAATGGTLPPALIGAIGAGKSLLGWHARHRFCPNCGAPSRMASAGWRRVCDTCGSQHFPRVDPVVIMHVARGEHCLLGRQERFAPGMYSCLAGFVEPGETAEDAVRREVMEEAGVRVGAVQYHANQPWPFPASLMLGFFAETSDTALTVDRSELDDARWFSRAEVRLMLAREHPDELTCPLPLAIAHTLLAHWAAAT